MGNIESNVLYDNVLELNKNLYFIYEYNDKDNSGIFKITSELNEKEEEIELYIREVIPIISKDFEKKINPVIDIKSGIVYKEIEDDLNKKIPFHIFL